MANAFEVRLIGADKLIADITKYSASIQEEIAVEIEDTARSIETKAKQDAQAKIAPLAHEGFNAVGNPIAKGTSTKNEKYDVLNFAQQITARPENKLTWEITAQHPMSAYFEFGTGVTVFQGETWVDDELKRYASLFIVNKKGTITPHPFLFEHFYNERIKLIETLKKITGA